MFNIPHSFFYYNAVNMSNANSEEAFNIRVGYFKPDTMEIAKTELRETPEIREAAIKELRDLLQSCSEICYRDDDEFLIIFLRACHFYPKSAFEKVINCSLYIWVNNFRNVLSFLYI